MEAPSDPVTVEPFPAIINPHQVTQYKPTTSRHSRPGPVYGGLEGVFQPSLPGKYIRHINNFFPDGASISSSSQAGFDNKRTQSTGQLSSKLAIGESATSQPGRTLRRTLEAPSDPVTVEPTSSTTINLASCRRSRPGPVYGGLEGVFQPALPGKYTHNSSRPLLEDYPNCSPSVDTCQYVEQVPSVSHSNAATINSSPLHSRPASNQPGRTPRSSMEVPSDPVTVEPFCVTNTKQVSSRRSRPGPVHGGLGGIFQPASPGKYACNISRPVPEDHSDFSLTINDINDRTSSANMPVFEDVSRRSLDSAAGRNYGCSNRLASNLHVYYQNVGGMNSTINDYLLASTDNCYDIIALTETWLNERTSSSQVFDSNYAVFRCDRCSSNSRKSAGGGVILAVRQ